MRSICNLTALLTSKFHSPVFCWCLLINYSTVTHESPGGWFSAAVEKRRPGSVRDSASSFGTVGIETEREKKARPRDSASSSGTVGIETEGAIFPSGSHHIGTEAPASPVLQALCRVAWSLQAVVRQQNSI